MFKPDLLKLLKDEEIDLNTQMNLINQPSEQ